MFGVYVDFNSLLEEVKLLELLKNSDLAPYRTLIALRDGLLGLPEPWCRERRCAEAVATMEAEVAFYTVLDSLSQAWGKGDWNSAAERLEALAEYPEALDRLPWELKAFLAGEAFPRLRKVRPSLNDLADRFVSLAPEDGQASGLSGFDALLAAQRFHEALRYLEVNAVMDPSSPLVRDAWLRLAHAADKKAAFKEEGAALQAWQGAFDPGMEEDSIEARVTGTLDALAKHYRERLPEVLPWYCRYGDLLLREFGQKNTQILDFVGCLYQVIRERDESALTPMAGAFLDKPPHRLCPCCVELKDFSHLKAFDGSGLVEVFHRAFWQEVWLGLESDRLDFAYSLPEGDLVGSPVNTNTRLSLLAARLDDRMVNTRTHATWFRFPDGSEKQCLICKPDTSKYQDLARHAIVFWFVPFDARWEVRYHVLWRLESQEDEERIQNLVRMHDSVSAFGGLTLFRDAVCEGLDHVLQAMAVQVKGFFNASWEEEVILEDDPLQSESADPPLPPEGMDEV